MPNITQSPEFLAGYILAKMSDLQAILDILASEAPLTESEMRHIRQRIDLIDEAVRRQSGAIHDRRLRPKLTIYENILGLSLRELERRERHRGCRPPESDAMRARRLRVNDDLDGYSSDRRGPTPLEYYTVVSNPPGPVPISAQDLRHALDNRRANPNQHQWPQEAIVEPVEPPHQEEPAGPNQLRSVVVRRDEEEAGPSGMQRMEVMARSPSPDQLSTDSDSASTGGGRAREVSPKSYRSRSSIASLGGRSSVSSYVSAYMMPHTRPRHDVPLPPIRDRNPERLERHDPDLIGRAEIYIRRPGQGCPMCGEEHRMIRCAPFKQLTLQEKWYYALNGGVCLNCLRWGHSSFRCIQEGACHRCGLRHNSLLCPQNPDNQERQ